MPRVLLSVITFLSDDAVGSCVRRRARRAREAPVVDDIRKVPDYLCPDKYQVCWCGATSIGVHGGRRRDGSLDDAHRRVQGRGALGDQLRRTGRPEWADSVAGREIGRASCRERV